MARPTIRDIGSAPSLSDPATFPARADATVGKLGQLVTDINAFGDWAENTFIQEASDAANAAAIGYVAAAETAKTGAETARTLAQDWAEKATAPGAAGTKSAKTHAADAAASASAASTAKTGADTAKTGADTAKTAAETAKAAAEAARTLAQDWAEKATAPGAAGTKSAKIHAADAAASAAAAATSKTGADSAKTAAEASAATATAKALEAAASALSLNVSAISKAIGTAAVDLCVYDTSRDSDPYWRLRCQHTSWENEALVPGKWLGSFATSTDAVNAGGVAGDYYYSTGVGNFYRLDAPGQTVVYRGNRRDHPVVTLIVAEAARVVIYDADDPALPMWMVFTGSYSWTAGSYIMASSGNPVSSIAARDGIILVGNKLGVSLVEMVADRGRHFSETYGEHVLKNGPLANRNTTASGIASVAANRLVNNTVNDIAITTLPDAPIDNATGLPVPTIACAADGGVSIIKHDGTVVDITAASWTLAAKTVAFAGRDVVFSEGQRQLFVHGIPDSDFAITGSDWMRGNAKEEYIANIGGAWTGDIVFPFGASNFFPVLHGSQLAIGHNALGLAKIGRHAETPAKNLHAYTTAKYTTGWLPGDIQLAALADTDLTALPATPYLDDDFSGYADQAAAVAAGYEFSTCTFDAANDQIDFPGAGTFTFSSAESSPAGVPVIIEVTISNRTVGNLSFQSDFKEVLAWGQSGAVAANGTFTFQTTGGLSFRFIALNSFNGSIDKITVRPAVADRSVKNKGLAVHGQLTKTPVATGAELVAYSGFSTSNYLSQPPNADLDFGTGDFCYMVWLNAADGVQYFFDRSTLGSNAGRISFYRASSGSLSLYIDGSTYSLGFPALDGLWHHYCILRKGGTLYAYRDGVHSFTNGSAHTLTNATARLRVGTYQDGTYPATGAIALLRASRTAPSADQIAKIYRDERALFQAGAQCTLYGTSDAVTALAHDPVTDLLHVGTSAGRSVFQGLRRVDNTTQAVGAAISAVGGLVADE